jgi:hypothetical protein
MLASMKRLVAVAIFLLSLSVLASAVEKQYQNGVILKNDQKKNTRVLYWVVDTPITEDDVYYDLTVATKDKVYIARYTPRHHDDSLPDQWITGSTAKVRVDGGHLCIEDNDGAETKLVIIKRRSPTPTEQISMPAQPAK